MRVHLPPPASAIELVTAMMAAPAIKARANKEHFFMAKKGWGSCVGEVNPKNNTFFGSSPPMPEMK
jgi:hypothetical protein